MRVLRLFPLALGAAAALACATSQPLAFGDRHLVVTIESFAGHVEVASFGRSDAERFAKRRWFDGTIEIEYEFEPAAGTSEVPYLYSLFELHRRPADACSSFSAGNVGAELGADLERHDELFRYGDRSAYGFVVADGERIGTFFNMCRARATLLVIVAGVVFDEPASWNDVVAPHLRAIEEYENDNP